MLAIDETAMALLSALVEALPFPVYVQEIDGGSFLYGNRRYLEIFTIPPELDAEGEFHDAANDRWYVLRSHPLSWIDGRKASLCILSDVTEERRARELKLEVQHNTNMVLVKIPPEKAQPLEAHMKKSGILVLPRAPMRLVTHLDVDAAGIDRALGEFASAVAHELNQPLAAIATYNHSCMRMLQSGNPDPEQLLQAMHICRDQAKRAGRIIQRLRGLLRHPGPALAEQDLNELVAAVLELAEPGARDAGVSFERALSARPPVVRADRLLIEQAALNLVRNAVEAVQELAPERRRITVATRVEPDGSGTLAVSDLGDGVLPEVRERLFDAFVTTKRGGLGLGLSICRSVVEAHGGQIRLDLNGRGARFAFTLPR